MRTITDKHGQMRTQDSATERGRAACVRSGWEWRRRLRFRRDCRYGDARTGVGADSGAEPGLLNRPVIVFGENVLDLSNGLNVGATDEERLRLACLVHQLAH